MLKGVLSIKLLQVFEEFLGLVVSGIVFAVDKGKRMPVVILILVVCFLLYGPALWIRFVMWRHGKQLTDMPGTGAELASHLAERFELEGVTVIEGGKNENFYQPATKTVSLSPEIYHGKSLTAVAVAAHEMGHAMQFLRKEPVSQLRGKYLPKVASIQRWGSIFLMAFSLISVVVKLPSLFILVLVIGIATMLASVLMYVAILPEEYDASFRKALPILAEGYVPHAQMPAVRQVLKAAALTYVAGALADILRLWRWIRILK